MKQRKCLTDLPTGPLEIIAGYLTDKQAILNFTSCSKVVYHRIKGAPDLWPELEYTVALVDTPEELQKLESFLKWCTLYHPCKTLVISIGSVDKFPTKDLQISLRWALNLADKLEHLTLKALFLDFHDVGASLRQMKRLKTANLCIKSFKTPTDVLDHACLEELSLEVKGHEGSRSCGDWLPKGLRKLSVTADRHCSTILWNAYSNSTANCTQLEHLSLNGGDGKGSFAFFSQLAAIPSLTSLDLSSYKMNAIPEELGFMTSLKHLNLCDNYSIASGQGYESFRHLSALTQLSSLNIAACELEEVPPVLLSLSDTLCHLDISFNQISSTHTLMPLEYLTYLDVSRNYELSLDFLGIANPFPVLQCLFVNHTEADGEQIAHISGNVRLIQVREFQLYSDHEAILAKMPLLEELRVQSYWDDESDSDDDDTAPPLLAKGFLRSCAKLPRIKKVVITQPKSLPNSLVGDLLRDVLDFKNTRPEVELFVVRSNEDKLFEI